MSYIGNEPTTGHFPVQTNLAGDGSATTFTMDYAPATPGAIEVSVAGVIQPTTSYSISGTTLTLPTAGTAIANTIPIFIRYLGETLLIPTPGDATVTDAKLASSGTMPAWNGAALTGITHTPANDSVDGAQLSPALVAGDIIYSDGTDSIERLAKGTAAQVLTMNTGATAPEWSAGGLQTIWIPAGAMRPTADNGCDEITDAGTQAGRPDMTVLDFAVSADKFAQFQIAFPKSWNEGTITFQVFWCSTATDNDAVNWTLQGVSVPDNSLIDVAYGNAVDVDDNNQGAAEEMLVSQVSAALTIAGAAVDTVTFFRIGRDVSEGPAAEDARLIGVKLFFHH